MPLTLRMIILLWQFTREDIRVILCMKIHDTTYEYKQASKHAANAKPMT